MRIIEYDRAAAVAYARKWAFSRNPQYYNFNRLGGDCTNFASQCLFAGAPTQNFTPTFGWYYRSLENRAPAWTGVEFFYRFLIDNAKGDGVGDGEGPFAQEIDFSQLREGDFVQFGRMTGDFYHTPIIVGFANGVPLVAAHSNDAFNRPINTYQYVQIRCLRILGVRTE